MWPCESRSCRWTGGGTRRSRTRHSRRSPVVLSGGDLVHGGDLREDGYTRFLVERLRTCSAPALRFHNLLAWPSHRKAPAVRTTAAAPCAGRVR
ncbi:hypothetical protein [Streptomyces sp. UG1]|uniref:hypothetical protein n=1 Tax=Streptomyces sp. UG1 TaxID=3417652 RepID=UPI003CF92687